MEKGPRSWLVSNSKTGICRLSCEVNRSLNTTSHLQLLELRNEQRSLCCCAVTAGSALSLLRLILPTSTTSTVTLRTPLLSAGRSRVWQQFLSRMYFLCFWEGSLVIWVPMNRFRSPSGGTTHYKLLLAPSAGKAVGSSLTWLKQSQIQKSLTAEC